MDSCVFGVTALSTTNLMSCTLSLFVVCSFVYQNYFPKINFVSCKRKTFLIKKGNDKPATTTTTRIRRRTRKKKWKTNCESKEDPTLLQVISFATWILNIFRDSAWSNGFKQFICFVVSCIHGGLNFSLRLITLERVLPSPYHSIVVLKSTYCIFQRPITNSWLIRCDMRGFVLRCKCRIKKRNYLSLCIACHG